MLFIIQDVSKFVINFTVKVAKVAVIHTEAYDFWLVIYNTICNTRIINIHLEYSRIQGLYKLLLLYEYI